MFSCLEKKVPVLSTGEYRHKKALVVTLMAECKKGNKVDINIFVTNTEPKYYFVLHFSILV